ncbi:AfsR/SARP family transcriptional regulator [Streptomyces sp. NPDC048290]|uniref:AfsR/SARP family transcriptional regulator n=1 Tax=Streptomyces sp. NPDC048290 TaxID=3155811 RepID=UPI00343B4D69
MQVRLLGPVQLTGAGDPGAQVSGGKRLAVLALLALEFDRMVPVERFFEFLWGEEPPVQARAALQGHIAALRKALAEDDTFTLVRKAPGYQMSGDRDAVDALRFAALTERAESLTDDRRAADLLKEALGHWKGAEALTGLPETPARKRWAVRLGDSRGRCLEAWAGRELRLGSGADAVPALEQAVRADPLREPAVALLVRCLGQAGRRSEALEVFEEARAALDEALGMEPGPRLREAVQEVRRGPVVAAPRTPPAAERAPERTPERPPVRLLPRRAAGFVGRARELGWLDETCGAGHRGSGIGIVVGPAGAGKSATVIRWAHTIADDCPDGQLYADLRGFDPAGPAETEEVLGTFLHALGMPEAAIPEGLEARVGLYRERTRDRAMLVVLDNAPTPQAVRPLLPAGPHCATVITSRNTLEDLVVAEGAALLRLDALPSDDARALLRRQLGEQRVADEPDAAERLVALCDRLPLALRIAAARLSARPLWRIADLVTELSDERTRLQAFGTGGATSVEAALALTRRALAPEADRLLALLAVHPGPEIDAVAAAALLGSPLGAARPTLGILAAYHLLTQTAPGRYSRHDLIRLYGAQLLDEQGPEVRLRATVRLLDHYLAVAAHAADLLHPRLDGPVAPEPEAVAVPLADVPAALRWFRKDEAAMRGLVVAAAKHGEYERAWRLAEFCNVLYYGAGRVTDRLRTLRSGLRAAEASNDPAAVTALECSTAAALMENRRPEEALALADVACGRTRGERGEARIRALATRALVRAASGDPAGAAGDSAQALEIIEETGLRTWAAQAYSNAAAIKGMAGDPHGALAHVDEALRILAAHPHATYHLSALVNKAHALQALGRWAEAEAAWEHALERCRTAGSLHLHALTARQLADFLLERGRPVDALPHLRSAIELSTQRGEVHVVDQLTKRLAQTERDLAEATGPETERTAGPGAGHKGGTRSGCA